MTGIRRLEDLLDDFGIGYKEERNSMGASIVINDDSTRVDFQGLYNCSFKFDSRGEFYLLEVEE